jgi:MarR family transcriptional regulator, lower aerobic nicotinate degradation pathway regulator
MSAHSLPSLPPLPPDEADEPTVEDLGMAPALCARRLYTLGAAMVAVHTLEERLSPIQFAALQAVHNQPGLDQRALAGLIAQDTPTTTALLDKLVERGFMVRGDAPADRRTRLLSLTDAGREVLMKLQPQVRKAQAALLRPLPRAEQLQFMRLLVTLLEAHGKMPHSGSTKAGDGA